MSARRALLLCGALSSVLYLLTIDVVAPLLFPAYHNYTSQMVSELMALDAPTRTLTVWLFVPYNLLVWMFAAGVWAAGGEHRATRLTSVALFGYAAMSTAGLLLAPMDLRTAGLSPQTWLHIGATALQGIFIAAALVLGAFTRGPRFRLYTLATLLVVVVFGAWAGSLAAQEAALWLGLVERVNIYAWMLWVFVFAVSLLTAVDAPASRPGT